MNIPLLAIRIYIAVQFGDSISVFLIKNVIAIMFGVIEVYDCCFDRNREHRGYQETVDMAVTPTEEPKVSEEVNKRTSKNEMTF